jgi:hypothetical protein
MLLHLFRCSLELHLPLLRLRVVHLRLDSASIVVCAWRRLQIAALALSRLALCHRFDLIEQLAHLVVKFLTICLLFRLSQKPACSPQLGTP